MSASLSLAYITNRRDCRIEWFYEAMLRQSNGTPPPIIVVDFWKAERDITQGIWRRIHESCQHVAPKPNVWNGPSRLTKENWFAAASQRNTAICLCATSHIAFIDDLSIPGPYWLLTAQQASKSNTILLGSYRKVKNLVVENGMMVGYTPHSGGHDSRWHLGSDNGSVSCGGELMFGCSLVAPIEAFLTINGFWEACDGTGFEDCTTGLHLQNAGYQFAYSRQLFSMESEELHHAEPAFKRSDYGVSPLDKSHALLNIAKQSKWCANYFDEGGLRKLRERVLAGEPFPVMQNPAHEWYSGVALKDL